jgi:hypothetical protein
LVPPGDFYGTDKHLKRKWVGEKLSKLEGLGLIRREQRPGLRPRIFVLRDDGSGEPLDDPGAVDGESYVTVVGAIFGSGRVAAWGSPQIAAYFAAMIAERYARADPAMNRVEETRPFGGGVWFRPLDWFEDKENRRPPHHVRIPFSTRTLRRGFALLRDEGVVATKRIHEDPRTGRPFANEGGRLLYYNGFDDLRASSSRSRVRTRAHWPLAQGED